ncbi:MAG: hypothetical protein QXE06_05375 [Candidatus Bathyarchaeia archaeon]
MDGRGLERNGLEGRGKGRIGWDWAWFGNLWNGGERAGMEREGRVRIGEGEGSGGCD